MQDEPNTERAETAVLEVVACLARPKASVESETKEADPHLLRGGVKRLEATIADPCAPETLADGHTAHISKR
jgi:hypothetical protein